MSMERELTIGLAARCGLGSYAASGRAQPRRRPPGRRAVSWLRVRRVSGMSSERRESGRNSGPAPETPSALPRQAWGGVLKRTVAEFREDNVTDWAAALTYYGVLSIFPALIALVSFRPLRRQLRLLQQDVRLARRPDPLPRMALAHQRRHPLRRRAQRRDRTRPPDPSRPASRARAIPAAALAPELNATLEARATAETASVTCVTPPRLLRGSCGYAAAVTHKGGSRWVSTTC